MIQSKPALAPSDLLPTVVEAVVEAGSMIRKELAVLVAKPPSRIEICAIPPDEIMIDQKRFAPDVHFSNWRNKQSEWTLGKEQRKQMALARAKELRADGKKNAQIAEVLNSEGLLSLTGRPWTENNIGKLINAASQT